MSLNCARDPIVLELLHVLPGVAGTAEGTRQVNAQLLSAACVQAAPALVYVCIRRRGKTHVHNHSAMPPCDGTT